ncbi:hypothetical protein LVD15_03275 [Fulvivirga maritima]|uniref:hypothetical protein n=1 Tax=Fulvivirga maritima TaxID=2904247 RepID=UPI001F1774D3|nr:hypothetical protein [Fulvivirga maritima]UII27467.1 hypothetical protein LVD15_03275 [Fulvivirga maritima]
MSYKGNSLSEKEIKDLFKDKKFSETNNNALKVDKDYLYDSPQIQAIYADMKK